MERYNSVNKFLKDKFGIKTVKLSLDAGFTCPNRDGKISTTGCIFCSERGSGDFAEKNSLSISDQIKVQKEKILTKWRNVKYIAYFQAYTNTYASVDILREKYYEALNTEGVCGIAIATRPDCLNAEVLELLKEISEKTYLWVELGLQTSNEQTAEFINRGYTNIVFEEAVKRLNILNIDIVVHLILGLPHETEEDIINSIKWVTSFKIQGIKLQLLHVLKNTPLEKIYLENPFKVLSMDEYINLVIKCLETIPSSIVIHRLTGDGPKRDLLEPWWSGNKKLVLNSLNKRLQEKNILQGIKSN